MLSPTDTWSLWALIVSGTALAIWLENNFKWAAKLSGPVIALLIAMVLSNLRIMPAESPAYDFIGDLAVAVGSGQIKTGAPRNYGKNSSSRSFKKRCPCRVGLSRVASRVSKP